MFKKRGAIRNTFFMVYSIHFQMGKVQITDIKRTQENLKPLVYNTVGNIISQLDPQFEISLSPLNTNDVFNLSYLFCNKVSKHVWSDVWQLQ